MFKDLCQEIFHIFLTQLENLLTKLYKPSVPIILCGDFNINFLDQTSRAIELALILQSFSLESIIKFPTRITPDSQSLIDNSFLDKKKFFNHKPTLLSMACQIIMAS
jgi:exonuclease III